MIIDSFTVDVLCRQATCSAIGGVAKLVLLMRKMEAISTPEWEEALRPFIIGKHAMWRFLLSSRRARGDGAEIQDLRPVVRTAAARGVVTCMEAHLPFGGYPFPSVGSEDGAVAPKAIIGAVGTQNNIIDAVNLLQTFSKHETALSYWKAVDAISLFFNPVVKWLKSSPPEEFYLLPAIFSSVPSAVLLEGGGFEMVIKCLTVHLPSRCLTGDLLRPELGPSIWCTLNTTCLFLLAKRISGVHVDTSQRSRERTMELAAEVGHCMWLPVALFLCNGVSGDFNTEALTTSKATSPSMVKVVTQFIKKGSFSEVMEETLQHAFGPLAEACEQIQVRVFCQEMPDASVLELSIFGSLISLLRNIVPQLLFVEGRCVPQRRSTFDSLLKCLNDLCEKKNPKNGTATFLAVEVTKLVCSWRNTIFEKLTCLAKEFKKICVGGAEALESFTTQWSMEPYLFYVESLVAMTRKWNHEGDFEWLVSTSRTIKHGLLHLRATGSEKYPELAEVESAWSLLHSVLVDNEWPDQSAEEVCTCIFESLLGVNSWSDPQDRLLTLMGVVMGVTSSSECSVWGLRELMDALLQAPCSILSTEVGVLLRLRVALHCTEALHRCDLPNRENHMQIWAHQACPRFSESAEFELASWQSSHNYIESLGADGDCQSLFERLLEKSDSDKACETDKTGKVAQLVLIEMCVAMLVSWGAMEASEKSGTWRWGNAFMEAAIQSEQLLQFVIIVLENNLDDCAFKLLMLVIQQAISHSKATVLLRQVAPIITAFENAGKRFHADLTQSLPVQFLEIATNPVVTKLWSPAQETSSAVLSSIWSLPLTVNGDGVDSYQLANVAVSCSPVVGWPAGIHATEAMAGNKLFAWVEHMNSTHAREAEHSTRLGRFLLGVLLMKPDNVNSEQRVKDLVASALSIGGDSGGARNLATIVWELLSVRASSADADLKHCEHLVRCFVRSCFNELRSLQPEKRKTSFFLDVVDMLAEKCVQSTVAKAAKQATVEAPHAASGKAARGDSSFSIQGQKTLVKGVVAFSVADLSSFGLPHTEVRDDDPRPFTELTDCCSSRLLEKMSELLKPSTSAAAQAPELEDKLAILPQEFRVSTNKGNLWLAIIAELQAAYRRYAAEGTADATLTFSTACEVCEIMKADLLVCYADLENGLMEDPVDMTDEERNNTLATTIEILLQASQLLYTRAALMSLLGHDGPAPFSDSVAKECGRIDTTIRLTAELIKPVIQLSSLLITSFTHKPHVCPVSKRSAFLALSATHKRITLEALVCSGMFFLGSSIAFLEGVTRQMTVVGSPTGSMDGHHSWIRHVAHEATPIALCWISVFAVAPAEKAESIMEEGDGRVVLQWCEEGLIGLLRVLSASPPRPIPGARHTTGVGGLSLAQVADVAIAVSAYLHRVHHHVASKKGKIAFGCDFPCIKCELEDYVVTLLWWFGGEAFDSRFMKIRPLQTDELNCPSNVALALLEMPHSTSELVSEKPHGRHRTSSDMMDALAVGAHDENEICMYELGRCIAGASVYHANRIQCGVLALAESYPWMMRVPKAPPTKLGKDESIGDAETLSVTPALLHSVQQWLSEVEKTKDDKKTRSAVMNEFLGLSHIVEVMVCFVGFHVGACLVVDMYALTAKLVSELRKLHDSRRRGEPPQDSLANIDDLKTRLAHCLSLWCTCLRVGFPENTSDPNVSIPSSWDSCFRINTEPSERSAKQNVERWVAQAASVLTVRPIDAANHPFVAKDRKQQMRIGGVTADPGLLKSFRKYDESDAGPSPHGVVKIKEKPDQEASVEYLLKERLIATFQGFHDPENEDMVRAWLWGSDDTSDSPRNKRFISALETMRGFFEFSPFEIGMYAGLLLLHVEKEGISAPFSESDPSPSPTEVSPPATPRSATVVRSQTDCIVGADLPPLAAARSGTWTVERSMLQGQRKTIQKLIQSFNWKQFYDGTFAGVMGGRSTSSGTIYLDPLCAMMRPINLTFGVQLRIPSSPKKQRPTVEVAQMSAAVVASYTSQSALSIGFTHAVAPAERNIPVSFCGVVAMQALIAMGRSLGGSVSNVALSSEDIVKVAGGHPRGKLQDFWEAVCPQLIVREILSVQSQLKKLPGGDRIEFQPDHLKLDVDLSNYLGNIVVDNVPESKYVDHHFDANLTLRYLMKTRSLTALIKSFSTESEIELKMQFVSGYPLRNPSIEITCSSGQSPHAMTLMRWKQRCIASLRTSGIRNSVISFITNCTKELAALEMCPICLSTVADSRSVLQRSSCNTCLKVFHPDCIQKCLKQAAGLRCPHCMSPW
eukprot:GHVN01035528.1.p1 GENE.GHVN01035528.1~~GHVN01035528.1.p1  ORF type:complete len:2286 (+),score=229.60 GHVN01035528.1:3250-10107(+)